MSGTWSVTPMTLPSVQARRKVAPVAPGQSRSGRGNLEQPVVDIWVKRVPTIPLPEPYLGGRNGSKRFGDHLIGPDVPMSSRSSECRLIVNSLARASLTYSSSQNGRICG